MKDDSKTILPVKPIIKLDKKIESKVDEVKIEPEKTSISASLLDLCGKNHYNKVLGGSLILYSIGKFLRP